MNQKHFLRGSELQYKFGSTLKDARVFPQDHIFAVDMQVFDNDDVASMIPLDGTEDNRGSKQPRIERGFQSSILTGN
jgi:hypothetical protein